MPKRVSDLLDESINCKYETLIRENEKGIAVVIERLSAQDKVLCDILNNTKKTNGRVTDLEKQRDIFKGVIIVMNTILIPILMAVTINFILNMINKK